MLILAQMGYTGTPEYERVRATSFGLGMKERWLARCAAHAGGTVTRTQDYTLVRWFHEHGIPQVVPVTTPLFLWGDKG
jgi:hypothetical protein